MRIKDEVDLANILGMAFHSYANRVENGNIAPYMGYLRGKTTVTVQITLNDDGSISVAAPFEPDLPPPEGPATSPLIQSPQPSEVYMPTEPEPTSKRVRTKTT